MKCELINEKAGDVFSEYTLGPHFIDFCRGPHVPDHRKLKAFKLLSIAGAYWKGDEKSTQLQRIYGTAFFTKKELEAHLKRIEEAKKRDHRKLGQELDLFSIQELAGPGLIFWHPKGGIVRKISRTGCATSTSSAATRWSTRRTSCALRSLEDLRARRVLQRNMFKPMELDDAEYQLKPMNCPGHILITRPACAAIATFRCGWANSARFIATSAPA